MHEFGWRLLSAFQCQTVLTVVLALLGTRHRSSVDKYICVKTLGVAIYLEAVCRCVHFHSYVTPKLTAYYARYLTLENQSI